MRLIALFALIAWALVGGYQLDKRLGPVAVVGFFCVLAALFAVP